MRVITGSARGRKLKTLEGLDVRPTSDKVKEGLFSAIQFAVEGRRVLDLFAGSGQLGIEALSRGARSAVFVDRSPKAIAVVKENIKACDMENVSTVTQAESLSYLKTCYESFDLAFVDPPYAIENLDEILNETADHMAVGATICAESARERQLPEEIGSSVRFERFREYNYGKTKITLYRKKTVQ